MTRFSVSSFARRAAGLALAVLGATAAVSARAVPENNGNAAQLPIGMGVGGASPAPFVPTAASNYQRITLAEYPRYALRVMEPGSLELCDRNGTEQVVGYLDVDDDKHFFFWFFASHRNPAADPVALWLNGGPGCSSMTGLFMELGPCRPRKGGDSTKFMQFGWNRHASMIFLDQPVNVGFSYSDSGKDVQDTVSAAKDVDAFLRLFFSKYTKYGKNEFHVFGESYAGHYIPAIGAQIVESNKAAKVKVNLKSLGIGNGLVDPLNQYEFYAEMGCNSPDYPPSLSDEDCESMRSKWPTCKSLISACYNFGNTFSCVPSAIYCNNAMMGPYQVRSRDFGRSGGGAETDQKRSGLGSPPDPSPTLLHHLLTLLLLSFISLANRKERLRRQEALQGRQPLLPHPRRHRVLPQPARGQEGAWRRCGQEVCQLQYAD